MSRENLSKKPTNTLTQGNDFTVRSYRIIFKSIRLKIRAFPFKVVGGVGVSQIKGEGTGTEKR